MHVWCRHRLCTPKAWLRDLSEQDQESAADFATEALSIQKYNELARVFGPTEIRLLTADTIIGMPLTRHAARRVGTGCVAHV